MHPEIYGRAINRIIIRCSFSYYDHDSCKCNYVIADEKQNIKKKDFHNELQKMYSDTDIKRNGYFLRNRYDYGGFQSAKGYMKVQIHFNRDFSELSYEQQKEQFSCFINKALETVISKLKKKKIAYDLDLMLEDFTAIFNSWLCETVN